jgi:hypothetical protein
MLLCHCYHQRSTCLSLRKNNILYLQYYFITVVVAVWTDVIGISIQNQIVLIGIQTVWNYTVLKTFNNNILQFLPVHS